MTDTLADALPREIARVSAKRDRLRDLMKEHPQLTLGMSLTIRIMQAEIDQAIRAYANDDIVEMLTSFASLKDYSDDD